MIVCISCGHEHTEKFCPNCGEKSDVEKITLSSIFKSAISTLIDMDRGFLYNLKYLLINPKKLTEDYINGKRKGIFNPISFLLVAVTVYLLIETNFKPIRIQSGRDINNTELYNLSYQAGKIIREYFRYFWVLCVFPYAMLTKLFFKRFNYLEHVANGAFIFGIATIVGTICYGILKTPLIFNPFLYATLYWLTYRVYKNDKFKTEALVMTFVILLLFVIILLFSIFLIGYIKTSI